MAAAPAEVSVHTPSSSTRTWRSHFPEGDLWVFGYGADHRGTPEAPGRVVTVIERSFWETLNDPQAYLETSSDSAVWGAAYHIPASHAEEVHDYLDVREINGYTVHYTPFHPIAVVPGSDDPSGENGIAEAGAPMTCMVYIGLPTNTQFLRDPAEREPDAVAHVISVSQGQSGKNSEYLYLLEKALEGIGLGSADGHVTDLVKRVKAIEEKKLADEEEQEAERETKKAFDPEKTETQSHAEFPRAE
ncbi:cation transport protein ChaC [Paecilomyces variotii No. 5]|uniref:glutathione-specific gamma-glutamylcyclotransferase n=1 Tax=Byssochlamys spectabilis (strain No. 5 / NBRC 109023) TaxID=1356009 RepID=V5I2M8_BYSSN|nr:cation transport protein ChaC [Paecilomyces variotii No. 5]